MSSWLSGLGASAAAAVVAIASPAVAGTLLVSGYLSNSVGEFDSQTGQFLAGLPARPGVHGPQSTVLGPDGLLYVCSEIDDEVHRYDPRTLAFIDVFIEAKKGGLDGPTAAIFGPDGQMYVASFETDSILRYDGKSGDFIEVFVDPAAGGLNGPDAGTMFDTHGDLLVPSYFTNRVLKYSGKDGSFLGVLIGPPTGLLSRPRMLRLRPSDGMLVVTSEANDRVNVYDPDVGGAPIQTLVTGIDQPSGLDFSDDGRMFVASQSADAVLAYDAQTGKALGLAVKSGGGGIDGPVYVSFFPDSGVPADLNDDGQVNGIDLGILLSQWGAPEGGSADLNKDGQVNGIDLGILLANWSL